MEEKKVSNRLVEPPADARTVRERTLAHLESLMRAATTTVGTGILLASGAHAQQPDRPMVVDPPPPPPPECCEHPDQFLLRGCIRADAVWAKADGQWILRLTLRTQDRGTASFKGLAKADIKLSGMTIKELQTQPKQVALVLAPAGDGKLPNLEFPVTCNSKKVPLKLSLDLKEGAAERRSVPVKVVK